MKGRKYTLVDVSRNPGGTLYPDKVNYIEYK